MARQQQLAELIVTLTADTKKYQKEMSGAAKFTSGFGSNLQKIGTAAMGALAAGAVAATTAVGGLVAALGKITMDAVPIQGIKAAFDGLAQGAGTSGDAVLAAFDKATGGMIASRDVMESFNKAAALVNIDFAQRLPEAMGMLGQVAMATGQDTGFLMDSLVTGIGRLSPMILDNLGVTVDATQAYEDYAAANGLLADDLTKTQQQAALYDQVLQKLRTNTAAMPAVTGTAAGSLAQFQAFLQNTADTIGLAFAPVIQEVVPVLMEFGTTIAGVIVPFLQSAGEAVTIFIQGLKAGVDPLSALKVALFEAFGPEAATIVTTIQNIIAGVQAFVAQMITALGPVITFVENNVQLSDVLIALGVAIAAVVIPALVSITPAILAIIAVFAVVVAVVAALRQAWESNFLGIREFTASVFESIQMAFGAFKSLFEGDFVAFWTGLENAQDNFNAAFAQVLANLWALVAPILRRTIENMKDAFFNIDWVSIGRDVMDGIKGGIIAGAGALADAARSAAQAALDAAKGLLGIRSPSSVAAAQIGLPFTQGIAQGIQSGADIPAAAAVNAAGAMTAAAGKTVTNNFNLTTNTTAPTSTVVQDFQTMRAMVGAMG